VGVAEVDAGGLHGRRARGHVRGRLALRGDGVVVLLLADAIAAQEDLVALRLRVHRGEVRLRLLQHAERAVERGAVGSRIDLVEPLPRRAVAARLAFTLERDAVDARPPLRDQVSGATARQLAYSRPG